MTINRDIDDHFSFIGKSLLWQVFVKPSFSWLPCQRATTLVVSFVTIYTAIGFCSDKPASAKNSPNSRSLVIEEFAWTNAVNSEREFVKKYEHRIPTGPIVFWTRVRATEDSIKALRDDGRLPIWHKWYESCGSRKKFDEAKRPIDEIRLGSVPRETIIQKLQTEVGNRGFFDWRTWSRKKNVSNCWYTIKVVDNKDTPLYCEKSRSDCKFMIKLGR